MSWFYGAWWCFTFGIIMLGALQIMSVGAGSGARLATRSNWRIRRAALTIIVMSYVGVACGLAAFAIAVVKYDISVEIHGGAPRIYGGPAPTENGAKMPTPEAIVGYILVGIFMCTFVGAFIYRISLRVRLSNAFNRRTRGARNYWVNDDRSQIKLSDMLLGSGND